jgi:hypothetical protein
MGASAGGPSSASGRPSCGCEGGRASASHSLITSPMSTVPAPLRSSFSPQSIEGRYRQSVQSGLSLMPP